MNKTKIFFDGSCIVCDVGVAHYKRLAPEKFEMIDISAADFEAEKFGLDKKAAQHHMHALTPEGKIVAGVDAFVHIWSLIPSYRLAAWLIQIPVIYFFAKIFYRFFARYRHWLPKNNIRRNL